MDFSDKYVLSGSENGQVKTSENTKTKITK